MKRVIAGLVFLLLWVTAAQGAVSDFEDLTVPDEGYYIGADGAGGFTSGDATFVTNYDATYGSWDGFAYSNWTDTTTPGFDNQYSAIAGAGVDASAVYAVGYVGFNGLPTVQLAEPAPITGLYVTNTTYAYLSMRDGDDFAKKFGGADGTDPDYFKLTIQGKDGDGNVTGEVAVYLADFRFDDSNDDYILDDWQWVDVNSLGTVASLEFRLESSDVGEFGMNTPGYFAIDDVNGSAPVVDRTTDPDGGNGGSGGCFIASAALPGSATHGLIFVWFLTALVGGALVGRVDDHRQNR
jgi:hypothetical protein